MLADKQIKVDGLNQRLIVSVEQLYIYFNDELNISAVESMNFEAPLVTELSAENDPLNHNRLGGTWGSSQVKDAEEDLNNALDEALENYDLATSWMESDGDKEVVRK